MASYHFHAKNATRGYGKGHASYICREGKYKVRDGEQLVYVESGNMPIWAHGENNKFWSYADEQERANGRVYKELEMALPNELSHDQQIELVKEFVEKELGKDFPYTMAIHDKPAANNPKQKQPHVHIMVCERKLDKIEREPEQFFKRFNAKDPAKGGAKKDRNWNKKEKIQALRKSWADIQNKYLEKYGHEARVDCRKLQEIKEDALEKNDLLKAELFNRAPMKKISRKILQIEDKDIYENSIAWIKKQQLQNDIEIKNIKEKLYKIERIIEAKSNQEKAESREVNIYQLRKEIDDEIYAKNRRDYQYIERINDISRREEKFKRLLTQNAIRNAVLNRLTKNQFKKHLTSYKKIEKEYSEIVKNIKEKRSEDKNANVSDLITRGKELELKAKNINEKVKDMYEGIYQNPAYKEKIKAMHSNIRKNYEKRQIQFKNIKEVLEKSQLENLVEKEQLVSLKKETFQAGRLAMFKLNGQSIYKQKGVIQKQIEKTRDAPAKHGFNVRLYDEKEDSGYER